MLSIVIFSGLICSGCLMSKRQITDEFIYVSSALYKRNPIDGEFEMLFSPSHQRKDEWSSIYDIALFDESKIIFSINKRSGYENSLSSHYLIMSDIDFISNVNNWNIIDEFDFYRLENISVSSNKNLIAFCYKDKTLDNFQSKYGSYFIDVTKLGIYDLNTKKLLKLPENLSISYSAVSIEWSLNGEYLAYCSLNSENVEQINILDINKMEIKKIIPSAVFGRWYKTKKDSFFYYDLNTNTFYDYNIFSGMKTESSFSVKLKEKYKDPILLSRQAFTISNDDNFLYFISLSSFLNTGLAGMKYGKYDVIRYDIINNQFDKLGIVNPPRGDRIHLLK